MSDLRYNFVSLALAGEVMMDEIDDFVDKWHEKPDGLSLHSFLGMSQEEYELWLIVPDMLPWILTARKNGQPIQMIANDNLHSMRIAARAGDALNMTRLQGWLQSRKPSVDTA